MFISRKRFKELEEEVCTLRAAVWNLQNLTRILERDICSFRGITAIGENAKESVLKTKD